VFKYHPILTRIAGEEAFLKKNHDVTIMTSSGHDHKSDAQPLHYRASFAAITLFTYLPSITAEVKW